MKIIMLRSVGCAAALMALGSAPAFAQQYGDWRVGFGMGVFKFTVENGPGNEFTISCNGRAHADGPQGEISISIRDKGPSNPNGIGRCRRGGVHRGADDNLPIMRVEFPCARSEAPAREVDARPIL